MSKEKLQEFAPFNVSDAIDWTREPTGNILEEQIRLLFPPETELDAKMLCCLFQMYIKLIEHEVLNNFV